MPKMRKHEDTTALIRSPFFKLRFRYNRKARRFIDKNTGRFVSASNVRRSISLLRYYRKARITFSRRFEFRFTYRKKPYRTLVFRAPKFCQISLLILARNIKTGERRTFETQSILFRARKITPEKLEKYREDAIKRFELPGSWVVEKVLRTWVRSWRRKPR